MKINTTNTVDMNNEYYFSKDCEVINNMNTEKLNVIAFKPVEDYTLDISNSDGVILKILRDGTVQTFAEGCEKEASKIFYESLQSEGKSLYRKIDNLESQLSETEEKLKRAYTEIVENWKQASGGCDDLYCVYCFWDEYDNKHEKDCIVLEAQTWLEDKE